ncbi:hypothetical protein DL98DRAFT_111392 [Cadophora sp. DSE1049]|nr:hypothetical protein DL98DRAFT_111392 [Cadophora sp. DSE1049]
MIGKRVSVAGSETKISLHLFIYLFHSLVSKCRCRLLACYLPPFLPQSFDPT